jgi:hypothetical protein
MYNIKMDLVEMGLGGLEWIGLTQDRYSWRAVVNTNELSDSINC